MNIETALKEAMSIEGALGVALVDWESGMPLGTLGGGKDLNLELAAAGNTEVVRASADGAQGLFLYLALDRAKSNLALARHHLRRIEADLDV